LPKAPKVRFGGFLVASEVLKLEIDDLWVNIEDKVVFMRFFGRFAPSE
jgi:hypothetical protein